jgi:hypothetical protein
MFTERETELFLEGLRTPELVQADTLQRSILAPNTTSEFGRKHDFAQIRTPDDYRRAVPIRTYEDYRADIDRIVESGAQNVLTVEPVRRFFMTSGSTAKPKYIPVTSSFTRDKSRAFGIYWSLALAQHPTVTRSSIVTNFSDSGSEVRTPGGLPASSESAYWGQVTAATQRRSRPIIAKSVAKTKDTEARYYALARLLLEEDFTGLMTLNPSTIYLLFQKMNEHAERLIADVRAGGVADDLPVSDEARAYVRDTYRGNPARADALEAARAAAGGQLLASAVWPALQLVVSWRSPMLQPYLRMLEPHLAGVAGRDYISMASEGIIAVPVQPGSSGGVVANGVHYYEFVPEEELDSPNPHALLPHELEVGRTYVTILSTAAGLYRYNIGDVVRVVGFYEQTPIIEFLHRAGNTCSLTGEKLTEDQVSAAASAAAQAAGLTLTSFTAAPADEGFPRYVLLVEPASEASHAQLERLRDAFEHELDQRNIEYGSKRESKRLGGPEVWQVKAGEYAARRQRRVAAGTNDAQFKPTHLTRDSRILRELEVVARVVWPA